MKSRLTIAIIIFILAALIVFSAYKSLSCDNRATVEYIQTNEGIISSKDFCVRSDSTGLNTSAIGTIYVEKDESNNYTAQIVAWIEIDPMDWGGVAFTIPSGWKVTSIVSSYPNSSFAHLAVGMLTSGIDWQQVEIGNRLHHPEFAPDGGSGSAIVELTTYQKGQKPQETLEFMVSLGSDEIDGTQIMHPDFETIEVPIIQND